QRERLREGIANSALVRATSPRREKFSAPTVSDDAYRLGVLIDRSLLEFVRNQWDLQRRAQACCLQSHPFWVVHIGKRARAIRGGICTLLRGRTCDWRGQRS